MPEQFKDIMDNIPGWQELGRCVEAIREDGSSVTGEVIGTDMTPGPDEWPILAIKAEDGEFSWFDFERWRYADCTNISKRSSSS
jgi:hypothetical protein